MQRINLGKPYEDYIQKMVNSGYFASASEVIRDALRIKMDKPATKTLSQLVQEGQDDLDAGHLHTYDSNFWETVNRKVEENIKNGVPVPGHLRP
jgi:putative addiction module CopG family antidote